MSTANGVTAASILQLAKDPPKDDSTRGELYEAARQLMNSIEPPEATQHRFVFGGPQLNLLQLAYALNIFETLAADETKEWSVDELATKSGADPVLMHRLLRALNANGTVTETGEARYKGNFLTQRVAESGFKAGIEFHNATTVASFAAFREFFAENKYRNPNDVKATPVLKALNFEGHDLFQYLHEHKDLAALAFEYFAYFKKFAKTWMDGSVPVDDFKMSEKDVNDGRIMMVDVGGASGHQVLAFRKAFPELKGRLMVQDTPLMINQIDTENAKSQNLEPLIHDFFTPQPVKGAKVYHLRNVLHDWPDETCKTILKHLREAMAADSVVVIDEIVLPKTGATYQQMNYDLTMMNTCAAMERSEKQWRELCGAVGLKVRDIWTYHPTLNSGVIVAVPV